jgi:hypothetical protein
VLRMVRVKIKILCRQLPVLCYFRFRLTMFFFRLYLNMHRMVKCLTAYCANRSGSFKISFLMDAEAELVARTVLALHRG